MRFPIRRSKASPDKGNAPLRARTIPNPVLGLFISMLVCLAAYLIYLPGLYGDFKFDDYPNIINNQSVAIDSLTPAKLKEAAFSVPSGPLMRPISMASFAVNHFLTGFNPYYFQLTNLAIHLVAGLGLYTLLVLLLDAHQRRFSLAISAPQLRLIAAVAAIAWIVHPLNLSSILYIVQRMASLAGMFGMWALALYAYGRIRLASDQGGIAAILCSVLILAPLSLLCKETGALLPLLMLVIEFCFFGFAAGSRQGRRFLIGFFALLVGLPAALFGLHLLIHPQWLEVLYAGRDFTLAERLMTEARVLWFYLKLVLLPTVGEMGLFHDDIQASRGLLQPVTTAFAAAGIVALAVLALLARKKAPVLSFGILFFLAGHAMESSILPLELVFEHRNYLPMIGPLFVLCYYLLQPATRLALPGYRRFAVTCLLALFAFCTFVRATNWGNPFDFAMSEVLHHPDSPRNNGQAGRAWAAFESEDVEGMNRHYEFARFYMERAAGLDPGYTDSLFALIPLSSARAKPVDKQWIEQLIYRLRHAPFSSNNSNRLLDLVRCQQDKVCSLAQRDLGAIFEAAAGNPGLKGANRAAVMTVYAIYLTNIVGDTERALAALRAAIKSEPENIEYRRRLVIFMKLLGKHEEAAQEEAIIAALGKKDGYARKVLGSFGL